MGDMIDRDAAIGALEDRRDKYLKDSQTWLQIQLDILAIRALPAIVPQPAPRLPDLGAREAALREAAQCAIDNQDCSPWEVSEAILNLIGKKPDGPHPAAVSSEDVRAGALYQAANAIWDGPIREYARAAQGPELQAAHKCRDAILALIPEQKL